MVAAKNYSGIKTRAKPRQIVCYFYRISRFDYNTRGRRKYRQNGHAYTSYSYKQVANNSSSISHVQVPEPWCSWGKPAPKLCNRAQPQPEQDRESCLCPQNNWGCQEPLMRRSQTFFLDNSYSTVKDPYKKKKKTSTCWLSCSYRRWGKNSGVRISSSPVLGQD